MVHPLPCRYIDEPLGMIDGYWSDLWSQRALLVYFVRSYSFPEVLVYSFFCVPAVRQREKLALSCARGIFMPLLQALHELFSICLRYYCWLITVIGSFALQLVKNRRNKSEYMNAALASCCITWSMKSTWKSRIFLLHTKTAPSTLWPSYSPFWGVNRNLPIRLYTSTYTAALLFSVVFYLAVRFYCFPPHVQQITNSLGNRVLAR